MFKISVKNVGGWSTERDAWLLMDASKPTGPPLNFRVETKTSTSVQLSWDLPQKWKRNGKIIGFELSYIQVGSAGGNKSENVGDRRTFELTGLKKFTFYKFWILAKTEAGSGPAVMIKERTMEDSKILNDILYLWGSHYFFVKCVELSHYQHKNLYYVGHHVYTNFQCFCRRLNNSASNYITLWSVYTS